LGTVLRKIWNTKVIKDKSLVDEKTYQAKALNDKKVAEAATVKERSTK
jgi:hypothetical protein